MSTVVGNIVQGIPNLEQVLLSISTTDSNAMTIVDGNYVVDVKPTTYYHEATGYDMQHNKTHIPPTFPLSTYLSNAELQVGVDICLSDTNMRSYITFDVEHETVILWHYNIKQLELLKEIIDIRSKEFYLQMSDHWSRRDYELSTEYSLQVSKLEKQYIATYGDLPQWGSIDNIWTCRDEINTILGS